MFFSRHHTSVPFQKRFHKFQLELLFQKVWCDKWNQWFCLIWSSMLNVDHNGKVFSFFPSIVITSFLSHEVVPCEHCITQFVQTHCSTTPFLNRSLTFSFWHVYICTVGLKIVCMNCNKACSILSCLICTCPIACWQLTTAHHVTRVHHMTRPDVWLTCPEGWWFESWLRPSTWSVLKPKSNDTMWKLISPAEHLRTWKHHVLSLRTVRKHKLQKLLFPHPATPSFLFEH